MLFPTVEFAIFFSVAFFASWALKNQREGRKWFLVMASYYFYAHWDYRFAFLLLECSLVNHIVGLFIERESRPGKRKAIMAIGITTNLLFLGFFKYFGFFAANAMALASALGFTYDIRIWEILLPMGISFYTFHGISYIIDVYRRDIKANTHFVDVLLYFSFFPQLVAGPIVRAKQFFPQLMRESEPNEIRAVYAFILIAGGLFKKIVIAHYLAVKLVAPVFAAPDNFHPLEIMLAAYGYAVQIYCDFSAYTDMAIGLAALLGFQFDQNFNQPYRAKSVTEFWRRWHISLSQWLRDYLYVPLGGNRAGKIKTYRNLMFTMLLGGLWHGAAWNFVVWGAIHGGALSIEKWWRAHRPNFRISGALSLILTFHFVCLTWVFFHAPTLSEAIHYLKALGNQAKTITVIEPFVLGLLALGLIGQFVPKGTTEWLEDRLAMVPMPIQGAMLGLWVIALAAVGPGVLAPFIYFKF